MNLDANFMLGEYTRKCIMKKKYLWSMRKHKIEFKKLKSL